MDRTLNNPGYLGAVASNEENVVRKRLYIQ